MVEPTENQDETNESRLSPEEIKQRRAEMSAYYEEELPLRQKELEYYRLMADIEEQRFRRLKFELQMMQILAPPPQQEPKKDTPPQ